MDKEGIVVFATAEIWEAGHRKGVAVVKLRKNGKHVFLNDHLVQERTVHAGRVTLKTTELGCSYAFRDTADEKAAETVKKFYY